MKKEEFKKIRIGDTVYTTRTNKMYENRKKWEAPNPNLVLSYIPGTVVEIYVKEGDTVKQGQELLLLEAMKMQNRITMPFIGKIKKINIEEGQRIPKNYIMIEIE